MNKENNNLEYLKKRLADLQQYVNREIEKIMDDVNMLEESEGENRGNKVTAEVKLTGNSWEHIPDVLRPIDIKEILNIGQTQAYDLIHSNQFHYIRIGRKYLIPKQSFIDWLEGNGNE